MKNLSSPIRKCTRALGLLWACWMFAEAGTVAATLSGSFSNLTAGTVVNLSREGEIDWVHWGLYTETSLDRKAGVAAQISDFTVVDSPAGFAYVYQFGDNASGYSWNDGTPTSVVVDTTTGVWAYGTPLIGSGFQISVPADSATRTLKVYVGTYGARGQMVASLSDGSVRAYTNTSLFNQAGGPGGYYTFTYSAASAGQQLIIRWTLLTPARPDGNVTLQAAALTSSSANNPPFVNLTSPVHHAKFPAGGSITLAALASDTDGSVNKVEFFANGTMIGEDTTSPYSFNWNNVSAGRYELTAVATDNQGELSSTSPVEIFVHGTGGNLTGSIVTPPNLPADVNLTTEGIRDWVHWGRGTNAASDRKAGVLPQISEFTRIGTNATRVYGDNYTGYSWSDGTPTATTNHTTSGIFTHGTGNGFEITAPADTNSRTLNIYVGLYSAQGDFQAWLSDFSAPAYTDTTISNYFGNAYAVYSLTYAAASSGQALTIRYRSLNLFDLDYGNVTLQAATLAGDSTGNLAPAVNITSPADGATFTAPAAITLTAVASDLDGSVAQVEFFNGTTSLGIDPSSPHSLAWNNVPAGTYTLTARATDNLGAVTASAPVVIMVSDSPVLPVTLFDPQRGDGTFGLSFASQPGKTYSVECASSLAPPDWQSVTNVPGNGATLHLLLQNVNGTARFYRVLAQ